MPTITSGGSFAPFSADTLAVLPSGDDVPGHGFFDGRITTIRMKGMRLGQQLAEYLNLLAKLNGWNHTLAARALSDRYGDHSGYAYDPFGGDSYDDMEIMDHYRLHADLLASISAAYDPCDFDRDGDVDLLDFEVLAAALTGPGIPSGSVTDVDDNGDVDLVDFAVFQRAFTGGDG